MKILFGIIGALIGAAFAYRSGTIFFGFAIGVIIATLLEQKEQIEELKKQIQSFRPEMSPAQKQESSLAPVINENEQQNAVGEIERSGNFPDFEPEVLFAEENNTENIEPSLQDTADPWTTNEEPAGDSTENENQPHLATNLFQSVKHFFTSGNVVVKVGVIILFFGVAFLLRYAAERNAFPIELRLAAVAAGAIVMLFFGWRLRITHTTYALVLQGGAVGILYLTVFSAAKLYHFLPLGFAFALMFALVILSCFLAVIQDSKSLASFATTGGFLAPVLTSTGEGSHVALFSYYLLLNAGILGIAWFKAWRILNWLGFVFTFVIASLWGYQSYTPAHFNTTEPFLIVFFLFYIAIAVLFAHRQAPHLKGLVDGSLVFGVPLVGFALQTALVRDFEFGRALSAVAMAGVYIALAKILWHKQVKGMRMLTESFLSLGIIFASLAIPFALDGHWTAATWSLEGACIAWVGIRQSRVSARIFGLLLQAGGALAFITASYGTIDTYPIINSAFIGSILISIAGLFSAYQFYSLKEKLYHWEHSFHVVLMIWGLTWWFVTGFIEIEDYLASRYEINAALFFMAISWLMVSLLGRSLDWKKFEQPPMLLLPGMAFFAFLSFVDSSGRNPFTNYGFITWVSAFSIQYLLLYRCHKIWTRKFLALSHSATLWLLIFISTWVIADFVYEQVPQSRIWGDVIWGLIPAISILNILLMKDRPGWPIQLFPQSYLSSGLLPVVSYSAVWIMFACLYEANPKPLTYFPIINPLDLTQIFSIIFIFIWLRELQQKHMPAPGNINIQSLFMVLGGIAFLWFNSVIAHTIHFNFSVPYSLKAMTHSSVFQTSISISWTLIAFCIMWLSTQLQKRPTWFIGAILLAVVVLKLFFVDLENISTVARIVSFMSVGILMLVIGYFSPIPPKQVEQN